MSKSLAITLFIIITVLALFIGGMTAIAGWGSWLNKTFPHNTTIHNSSCSFICCGLRNNTCHEECCYG